MSMTQREHSHEAQKNAALKALSEFKAAAANLEANWHPCLERGYPFQESFDDWVSGPLLNWVNEANMRYPYWLEFIAIQLGQPDLVGAVAAVYEGTQLNVAYATFDMEDLDHGWTVVSKMRVGYKFSSEALNIARNSTAGAFREPMSANLVERLGLVVSLCR